MSLELLSNRLEFLREAERLKDVLRSAHTSSGRPESTAEHSWRLCLMALAFEDQLAGLDLGRFCACAWSTTSAKRSTATSPPSSKRRTRTGRTGTRRPVAADPSSGHAAARRLLALWDEYERGETAEALAVKALDKLETLLQHTQGDNPADFDYAFNLDYGRRYTDRAPLFKTLRELLDARTRQRLAARRDA